MPDLATIIAIYATSAVIIGGFAAIFKIVLSEKKHSTEN